MKFSTSAALKYRFCRLNSQRLQKITSNYSAPAKTCAFYTKTDSNCPGLSYLCLVQGEKAQFSRLNEHFSTMK